MEQKVEQTTEEMLESLFSSPVAVQDENAIILKSNLTDDKTLPLDEPASIEEVLGEHLNSSSQIMIDGTEVNRDHIIAPGATVYIHEMVEGG